MKIQTQLSAIADTITKSGSILTINGIDYDLNNLSPKQEPILDDEGRATNQKEIDAMRVWQDESGNKNMVIMPDTEKQFMFINGNLLRFYDLDNRGEIDEGEELDRLVDAWNMTPEERLKYHKSRL